MKNLPFQFRSIPMKKLALILLMTIITHSTALGQYATNNACSSQSLCPGASGCMDIDFHAWSTTTYAKVKYYYTIEKSGTGTIYTSPLILWNLNTTMNLSFNVYVTPPGLFRVTVYVFAYNSFDILVHQEQASSNYVSFYQYTPGITARINGNPNNSVNVCHNAPINFTNIVPVCISTNAYFLSIRESDAYWNVFGPEKTQWISGALPSSVDMKAFSTAPVAGQPNIPLVPGHYYRMTFAVGPTWYATSVLVYIQPASPGMEVNGVAVGPNYGPFTICSSQLNSFLTATTTACESMYFISVEESDQWWNRTFAKEWKCWFPGTVNAVPIQALTGLYSIPGMGCTTTGAFSLNGGTLPGGGDRYWRITLATGEPSWSAKTILIRVDDGCRTAPNVDPALLNENGEIDLSSFVALGGDSVLLATTIAKENERKSPGVKVYPNPVLENLNLTINAIENSSRLSVTLYDITGKKVKEFLNTESVSKGEHDYTFTTSGLGAGMYYLCVQTDHYRITEKVVVGIN